MHQFPAGWPPQRGGASPPSFDALTEHRMEIAALKERAEKHGAEIDEANERIAALEKRWEAAKRWAISLCTSGAGLIGHWQQEAWAKKAGAILSAAAAALK